MSGVALLWTMSFLPTVRVPRTASTRFERPYLPLISAATAAPETKATDVRPTAPPSAPNMRRIKTGCGVGMEAFGSPICAHAMVPPLITISGLAPNSSGFHSTMSASLPTCREPTRCDMPCASAGFTVYLATYLLMRALSWPEASSSGSAPRCFFILSAVCQVRVTTSPTRPIAWESDDMTEMAPRSCRMSSAAMVSPRIRLSAKATSSGMFLSRWWQTMSMSKCSSMVLTVKGRVGLVDDGNTCGSPHTLMMSGACPPPAPSEWYVWIVRPPIAASESST
mmetsp:Transcript_46019/g.107302  ORF Transcript_46019/g.107302 Transcript_46019/m.107302 type:complete len:281 (-) Transcript_46019:872-1714(-)